MLGIYIHSLASHRRSAELSTLQHDRAYSVQRLSRSVSICNHFKHPDLDVARRGAGVVAVYKGWAVIFLAHGVLLAAAIAFFAHDAAPRSCSCRDLGVRHEQ